MARKTVLLTLALLLLGAGMAAAQTEIPGTVIAVSGDTVTIHVPGEILPREGDPVRLRFRDPVAGVGLVFLDGAWEVRTVRRDQVDAVPRGETPEPQEGLVAAIASERPQSKAEFTPAPEAPATPTVRRVEEAPVAAQVRERDDSDVERIDRRRWFTISAGAALVSMESPAFFDYEPDSELRPRITASAGIHILPNLAVSGLLGATSVDGTSPSGGTQSAQEIYKGLGATLYLGTPGNVPGDLNLFLQGGMAWHDVHYGGAGQDPDVTGSGVFGGGGMMFTLRRGFGIYASGLYFGATYDDPGTDVVFERIPAEIRAGATVIF